MKSIFKENQMTRFVITGVMAAVIAGWIFMLQAGMIGFIGKLDPEAKTILTKCGAALGAVVFGLGVTYIAGRFARQGADQPAAAGGGLGLTFAPRRTVLNRFPNDAIADLEKMVGLAPVKREVNGLIARLQVERKRREQNLPAAAISLHMVFTGPPESDS